MATRTRTVGRWDQRTKAGVYLRIGPSGLIQECVELIDGQPRLPKDGTKCAAVEFFVIRHDKLCERRVAAKDDVTPLLASDMETGALERLHTFPAGNDRQSGHTVTTSAFESSGGTGR